MRTSCAFPPAKRASSPKRRYHRPAVSIIRCRLPFIDLDISTLDACLGDVFYAYYAAGGSFANVSVYVSKRHATTTNARSYFVIEHRVSVSLETTFEML